MKQRAPKESEDLESGNATIPWELGPVAYTLNVSVFSYIGREPNSRLLGFSPRPLSFFVAPPRNQDYAVLTKTAQCKFAELLNHRFPRVLTKGPREMSPRGGRPEDTPSDARSASDVSL